MTQASSKSRIQIELPAALRVLADQAERVELEADDVAEALTVLGQRYPHLLARILTRGGQLRPHVKLFVNDGDIRHGDGLETALADGDVIIVVPSVAGG